MSWLLAGIFNEHGLASSYERAFRDHVETVNTVDVKETFEESLPFGPFCRRFIQKFETFRPLFARRYNRLFYEKVEACRPDALLVFHGLNIHPDTLVKIRQELGTLLLCFNPDDPFKPQTSSRFHRESMGIYDYFLTWAKYLIPRLREAGARRVVRVPFGCDPHLHHPVDPADLDAPGRYRSRVAFIGSHDEKRERVLSNVVEDTGEDLKIWGKRWDRADTRNLRDKITGQPITGSGYSRVCSTSDIMLNILRDQNLTAHNMRTFEVLSCGGFLLTERTEEQTEMFTEGEQIECYGSREELRDKIAHYLEHPRQRKAIARAGFEAVRANHTYSDRVRTILEHVKEDGRNPV